MAPSTAPNILGVEICAIDRVPYQVDAKQIALPGSEGLFVVMPGYAPLVAALDVGIIRVQTEEGERQTFAIAGGVVRVLENQVLVLARTAEMNADIDRDRAEASKKRAEERMQAEDRNALDMARAQASLGRALARLQAVAQHQHQ